MVDPVTRGYMPPSGSVEWLTPPLLYQWLNSRYGPFTFDPSPYPLPPGFNGLTVPWKDRWFCNPPYGLQIRDWVQKGYEEMIHRGKRGVFLLPSRTDVRWFAEYAPRGEVIFITGRVHYQRPDGSTAPAPFPSLILAFGYNRHGFSIARVPGTGAP